MKDEIMNESVETQEVAEPETEELASEETQEVAEPAPSEETAETNEDETSGEHQKNDSDSAFAEMRRNNQGLEKTVGRMREALSKYFEGETDDDLIINALAFAEGREPDDYRQEYQQSEELETLRSEKEDLENQLLDLQVEKLLRDDLVEIQGFDPNIKSIEDLGESFLNFRANGLSTKEAYYASKAMELKEKVLAPGAIGKLADTKTERDYYTWEEIDALSDEDMDDEAVWSKVMHSMEVLSKK